MTLPALLLVEDDKYIREILVDFLSRSFNVIACESVAQSLEWIRTSMDIHLLLTDFMLGDGDGLQVAEAVRAKFSCTPIKMMTGASTDQDRVRVLLAMSDTTLIQKPFNLRDLENVLRSQ
jgi:DNA-binding response OmpR family regulator